MNKTKLTQLSCIGFIVFVCLVALPFSHAELVPNLHDVTTVQGAPLAQQFPDVAYNSTNNTYLIVWEHVASDGIYDIYGVIANAETGELIGEPAVLMTGDQSIEAPEIAYNRVDNEYLLVARRKSDNMAIANRISAQGEPVGDLVEIDNSYGSTFFDPAARARVVSVAHNATDNQYLVALGSPIIVHIFEADLTLFLLSDNLDQGSNPAIAWSSQSNTSLVAYEDRNFRDTGGENLSAVFVSNLAEADSDILFIRDQDFAEESPRIAYNPDDDQFLVIWDERFGYSDAATKVSRTDTFGQIINMDGSFAGDPIPIEFDTPYTLRQDIDYNPVSQIYLVVWKGDPSGDFGFADIYGRFINRDGTLDGPEFLIYDDGDDNTDMGTSEQYFDESKLPVVAANTQDGSFLVVWEEGGTNQEPEDRDILSRIVSITGTTISEWSLF